MSAIPESFTELYSRDTIAKRVEQMGKQIATDFAGRPLTALVVLKGSFVFAADLLRAIDRPMHVEFIGLRSYGDRITTSGVVEITLDVKHPLEGQHVLIVEDIVDTGLTSDYLLKNLFTRAPASLSLATLLHKPQKTQKPVEIDYLGFVIPDHFVVGYGLDYMGKYRNIPSIGFLTPQPK